MTGKTLQRGMALLELVVVLPVLMVMLFAIIELGMIWYDSAILTNTSREAARTIIYAHKSTDPVTGNPSMTKTATTVKDNVCDELIISFTLNNLCGVSVSTFTSTINSVTQTGITVDVTLTFTTLVLGKLTPFPDSKQLHSTTSMYFLN